VKKVNKAGKEVSTGAKKEIPLSDTFFKKGWRQENKGKSISAQTREEPMGTRS